METLLLRQRFLIQQARRWNAADIGPLYEELSQVAAQIAALWEPEYRKHE